VRKTRHPPRTHDHCTHHEPRRPRPRHRAGGFDAHRADPLADLRLDAEDFGWLTDRLLEIGGGRLVSVLEGGYDLGALAASVAVHVRRPMRH
jgi:acetoin utilization deacetylase AcuC-like enzyme